MANHITINGQTYSSVDQMPADVRQQYETAMQLLSQNTGASADASAGDVSISTAGTDPAHTFKTVTKMTTSRIVVNGKEYARWEDVPLAARAAFRSAGVNPQTPFTPGARRAADIADAYQLNDNSSSTISLSLTTLIILLLIVLFVGVCVGHLLR